MLAHQDHEPRNLTELVLSGDWACAHQDAHELAEVAHLLAPCVEVTEQMELDRVARLAAIDMVAATAGWVEVTDRLLRRGVCRARGIEPPPVESAAR